MAQLSTHKLFIHDHLNSRELSEIFLKEKGDLAFFVLLEMPKGRPEHQSLIDQIIDRSSTDFETIRDENPEALLEEILQRLNQNWRELSTAIKTKNWLTTMDMAVGIIYKNQVYLSSIGNVNGLLIRFNQFTPILEKSTDINPAKIFANIVSGALEPGDVLIVSTNSLFDYISKEKIKQITKQYSASASVIKIQELLETVPDFVTFNGLIIKNPTNLDREIPASEIQARANLESEPHHDSIAVNRPAHVKTKLVVDFRALQKIKFFKIIADIFGSAALYFRIIGKVAGQIGRRLKKTYLFLTSKKYRQLRDEQSLQALQNKVSQRYNWFSNLTRTKKISLIVLFIVLLAFLQGLVFLTQKKAEEKEDSGYKQALSDINNKFVEVDAKLLYNDEQSAENILLEISITLNNLTIKSPRQQDEINRLKEKVWHDLNKVRRIHDVSTPTELADLSTLSSPEQIVQKAGKFYILDNSKLYVLENASLTPLADFVGGQYLADWPDQNKLVLGKSDQYFIFNLDNKTLDSFEFAKSAGNTAIKDMEIYSSNLYVLDSQNNQIFKYPESGSGFAGGTAWLRQETIVQDAQSFAIDGSIYTLHSDGKIKNWLKGEANPFDYNEPHPVIGSGATIKTFRDSDLLYIIDPENQRVIILGKDGNIKDQYSSQKFDDLKDLAIDPEEKAIYLLNGNHLYLLAIN